MKELNMTIEDPTLIEELAGDLILSSWHDGEENWTALFENDEVESFFARITPFITPMPEYTISDSDAEEIDWLQLDQDQLPPLQIGPFYVYLPHHDSSSISSDNSIIPIKLNCPNAFGSGHHHTTHSCLQFLAYRRPKAKSRILDLGCGSGILAIAAKKLVPDAEVWAVDIDSAAIASCEENSKMNEASLTILSSEEFFERVNREKIEFDYIFANIHSNVLIELAEEITKYSSERCGLILSGYLHEQANELHLAYKKLGWHRMEAISDPTWETSLSRKVFEEWNYPGLE